jgi:hypothetical protein
VVEVGSGEHGADAGHRERSRRVDAEQACMGVRRAGERGVQRVREAQVGKEPPAAQ